MVIPAKYCFIYCVFMHNIYRRFDFNFRLDVSVYLRSSWLQLGSLCFSGNWEANSTYLNIDLLRLIYDNYLIL